MIQECLNNWNTILGHNYAVIDDIDWEKASRLSLFYNGELVYFINTKPFNLNILGNLLQEVKDE